MTDSISRVQVFFIVCTNDRGSSSNFRLFSLFSQIAGTVINNVRLVLMVYTRQGQYQQYDIVFFIVPTIAMDSIDTDRLHF